MSSQEKILQLVRQKDKESRKSFVQQTKTVQSKIVTAPIEENQNWINSFLRIMTAILVIILISVIVYFVWFWVNNKAEDVPIESFEIKIETKPIETQEASVEDKSMVTTAEIISNKSIEIKDVPLEVKVEAQALPIIEPKKEEEVPQPPAVVLPPLYEQIKLVGIVMDEHPNAIIEDLKTNTTRFLFIGDSISNAVLVELNADKAVFEYDGKKVELRP